MKNQHKIVIIDDEEVVLDSCTLVLEGGDYSVTTASDGASGLKLVEEIQPDLVFIDLKMPGIPGIEVLEKISKSNPTIVSIVITGYATVTSAVEAMKNGAYDFLPKPFTPDEFRLITKRGLERRKLMLETIALRKEKEMLRENFAAIFSPISITSVITKSIEIIEPQAIRKDVQIITSIDESMKPIEGEEVSFQEALVNIFGNAIKYSYPGGKVTIKAQQVDENILITISDTGVGIPKEELPYVLVDFFRGISGMEIEDSHGLGLTISRRIIEAHKGKISVERKQGEGTNFYINVPTQKKG